jgi:hypothetical protein
MNSRASSSRGSDHGSGCGWDSHQLILLKIILIKEFDSLWCLMGNSWIGLSSSPTDFQQNKNCLWILNVQELFEMILLERTIVLLKIDFFIGKSIWIWWDYHSAINTRQSLDHHINLIAYREIYLNWSLRGVIGTINFTIRFLERLLRRKIKFE